MLIGYVQNGIALGDDWKPKEFDCIDGKPIYRKFFDETGMFILGKDETLLFSSGDVKVDIYDDWAPSSARNTGKYIFKGYRGAGVIYLTNKRMFHVRAMDPLMAGLDHSGTGGLPGAILDPMLARKGRALHIFEYCEIELKYINSILIVNLNAGKIAYNFLKDWKRYKIILDCFSGYQLSIFHILENLFREKEKNRFNERESVYISYGKMAEIHLKFYWQRDDLLKKAEKYEKKGKLEKALIQYQKILELFPDDESTRKKVDQLSGAK